ncbi:DUF928 domain-containing protein [Pelatocladus sp. BLCC-F211]|uniref:DUF928 domain-containing protein n=1 Tax=Pelatocladus sp. BLCC-F211 TaxID=3342752 RepID=UPI0035B7AE46
MTKLLFRHLSLALIFTLILSIYPVVKAAPQPSKVWENEVILKQQQRQKPKTPKATNTPRESGLISRIISFILPPKGAPGQRTYAAARADCPAIKKSMTALVPPTNIGLTISERPTFWFYIPYQPTSTNPVEFLLLNENNKEAYKTTLQLTNTPGIISITLPQNSPALESGKKYNWVLSFICDPENRLKDTFVKGYIERVSINSNLKNQLERVSTPREQILLFAENSLWYDALTLLAEERRKKPNDTQLAKDWKDLLQLPKVELQEFVSEPIISCCRSTQ